MGTVPIAALVRVDIDANDGLGISAMYLAQAVVEYDTTTFVTQPYVTPDPHAVPFRGLLLSPQQSADVVVPGSALNPAGHCVHADAEAFENVSAGHVEHDVAASCV